MNSVKLKIIYSLFALAALLLVMNVLVDGKRETKKVVRKEVTEVENHNIEQKFINVLHDWSIKDNWIKKVKIRNAKSVSGYIYQIKLPRDVTQDFLLVDFRNAFKGKNEEVVAEDLIKKGKTSVMILSGNKIVVEAYFRRDYSLKREKQYISLVVDDRDGDLNNLSENMKFVTPLTFLLRPDSKLLSIIPKMKKHKHSFAIFLDENIEDSHFDLLNSNDKYVLKVALSRIVKSLGRNTPYVYDKKSDFYKSINFNFIKDELKNKYNISLISISAFKDLTSKDASEIESIIKIYLTNTKYNIFLIGENQLKESRKLCNRLWKRGVRFLSLSKYLNRQAHSG
jgi:hypothetical protein